MIVNELKQGVITFGCNHDIEIVFNNQEMEAISHFKYFANIVTALLQGDIFREYYNHPCSQTRKVIFW